MMKTTLHHEDAALLLTEETVSHAGLSVTYRLTASAEPASRNFYLSAIADKDSCTASVGSDLIRAAEIFRTVSQGFVTPCTLPDVLSDLQTAKNW